MNDSLSESYLREDPIEDWAQDERFQKIEFELSLILDPKIKHFVMYLLGKVHLFWTAPASQGGNHSEDEYQEGGLLLYTKRTVRTFLIMESTLECSIQERDCAIAALLLRNATKAVPMDEKDIIYDPFHLYTVAGFLENCLAEDNAKGTDLGTVIGISADTVDVILRLIRTSHGFWTLIPETMPTTILEKGVALASILTANITMILEDEHEDEQ